ncbi:hypothetical protein BH20BAC1_BH20BAC1_26440 [soil metagenome]
MKNGKLILIGAGPGDPELLTLKAVRHLQAADVILTDRLVSREILTNYANEHAEIVYVGKQCRMKNSTPQQTINELIAYHCLSGMNVIRLKGGDVSIFSNITDELQTAISNGITFEIVPGITAALGAAAYAGIPLTARGYATSVRFVTLYKADLLPTDYWKELAATDDTLVFYMSAETLDDVVENLLVNHVDEGKKLAVIEQATTPYQKVYTSNIHDYHKEMSSQHFASPSIVIIGKVVSLQEQFAWIENSRLEGNYFPSPLLNKIKTYQPENLFKHAS